MSEEFKDDTFLARWLNGDLTKEELASFMASPEYKQYSKIVSGAGNINSSGFDQDALLEKIKTKTQGTKSTKSFKWIYAAAASLILIATFALYSLLNAPDLTIVISKVGEKKTLVLPDGSEVFMNANSQIAYTKEDWHNQRLIELSGEAYFKVAKGKEFTVKSTSGEVKVLGTQFNVQDVEGFYEVKCFEGSVSVASDNQEEILKPKHAVRKIRGTNMMLRAIKGASPEWTENRSSFTSVPLKHVLNSLKNQYKITYEGTLKFGEETYTGTFPHDDLEVALKVVFSSIPYDYQLKSNGVVVILEK